MEGEITSAEFLKPVCDDISLQPAETMYVVDLYDGARQSAGRDFRLNRETPAQVMSFLA